MAFIVGYITKEEKQELERRGWEVENATDYGLVGDLSDHLLAQTPIDPKMIAVAIFVDNSVFDVMDGPDWEKGD